MSVSPAPIPNKAAGPAWEIALLWPEQGALSESDYIRLTANTNRLVEYADGSVEVLPMPKTSHQRIVMFLLGLLNAYVQRHGGEALPAPLRVKLRTGKFREPDIVFMLNGNRSRIGEEFWDGADLVIEVVSEDEPQRDLIVKRTEYAEAGIPEYWIVDPRASFESITVLRLAGNQYDVHGRHTAGTVAASHLLPGFSADVSAVLNAAK